LTRVATTLGFPARAVRVSPEALPALPLPAIALLAEGHYVVLYEWGPSLRVGDPARGVLALSRADFLGRWSGHLLLLRGDEAPGERRPEGAR
jgi:ABC-type bacteriocin/lantibiotic exporter with double-glycine peptidase domain